MDTMTKTQAYELGYDYRVIDFSSMQVAEKSVTFWDWMETGIDFVNIKQQIVYITKCSPRYIEKVLAFNDNFPYLPIPLF